MLDGTIIPARCGPTSRAQPQGAVLRAVPRQDWQPDASSASCTACAAPFSWRRRRHHCHGCGALVCAHCSAQEIALPRAKGVGYDKVRVCNVCSTLHYDAAAAGPSAQLPLPSPRAASPPQCPAVSASPSSPWTPRSSPPPSEPSTASPGCCYCPVPAPLWKDPRPTRRVVFTDARTGEEHVLSPSGWYGRLRHRLDGAERFPVHGVHFCSDGAVYVRSPELLRFRRIDPPDAAAVQRLWELARYAGVEVTKLRVTAYCTMPNGLRVPAEYAPPAEAPPPARPWYKAVAGRVTLRRRGASALPQRTAEDPVGLDRVVDGQHQLYAPSACTAHAAAETADAPACGGLGLGHCNSGTSPRPAPRHLGAARRLWRWVHRTR
eukprot:TRINITY_DN14265_c0_g1_i5.p1 TRINITY_DN14265_c0_g1~~TRINITY_DN14265_c0_g1_i5.p1  ORF type:complete len:378 (+),score=22.85 TRINITY_DN14265_c0_g1_i5:102-1235(+)